MFSSLFIGKADYISAVAREIFPLFGPVAPLEALLESGQCTLRLAELRTALADEAMLDLAFDPKSEEPWSDAVRLRVEAYTDGLVDALCAQHVPSDRIVCQVARHMALVSGDATAAAWLEKRGIAWRTEAAAARVCTPPPFSGTPMARECFRIASFKALPRFTSQLFLRHPPAGALTPLLSKAGAKRLGDLAVQARRHCLRFALHREEPALCLSLARAFRDWETAARRMLVAQGWKPEELDRRVARNGKGFLPKLDERWQAAGLEGAGGQEVRGVPAPAGRGLPRQAACRPAGSAPGAWQDKAGKRA